MTGAGEHPACTAAAGLSQKPCHLGVAELAATSMSAAAAPQTNGLANGHAKAEGDKLSQELAKLKEQINAIDDKH